MVILSLISYKIFPANMGGQKGIAQFYKYFSTKVKTEIVVARDNEPKDIPYSSAHSFLFNHKKGLLNIFNINKLVLLIKEKKVDVVIIEHSYFGWIGILLKSFTGKPFIIHSHNIEAQRFKAAGKKLWRLYDYYECFIHAKAKHVFYKCEEDAGYALENWKLKNHAYTIIPFGTEIEQAPSLEEKQNARNFICGHHHIEKNETLFLFNGTLDFTPNVQSLQIIMECLVPYLENLSFNYKIIICGNRINETLKQQLQTFPNIVYAGFVNNIDTYFKAVDAFINPSPLATGIKTKLVEALANNTTVITSQSSTRGFNSKELNGKLIAVEDNNHKAFAEAMVKIKVSKFVETPSVFYKKFHWNAITTNAIASLEKL